MENAQIIDSDLRKYAWNYFKFHADQRLKTFHFYILISTILAGVIVAIIKETTISHILILMLGVLLATISFIFWKLDTRNKALIKHAENALKKIELTCQQVVNGEPDVTQIFLHEEWLTNQAERMGQTSLFKAHLSYSDCFNAIFSIFGGIGLLVSTISILCLTFP